MAPGRSESNGRIVANAEGLPSFAKHGRMGASASRVLRAGSPPTH